MSLKHSKKRNSGLVYEFLVRRMASSVLSKDRKSYALAADIAKRYYSPGTPISKEKEIFDAIIKTRGASRDVARRILQEVRWRSHALDSKAIEIKKSNLIKEINYGLGQNLFDDHRISEYRLYASIQVLIDKCKPGKSSLTEDIDKIRLEEALISYMMLPVNVGVTARKGETVDSLTAMLAMKKFEEKYSSSLNEAQKRILRKFMDFSMTGDDERFVREMEDERSNVIKSLNEAKNDKCFISDEVMTKRMNEAIEKMKSLDSKKFEVITEELMLYHKLLEEVDSDDQ